VPCSALSSPLSTSPPQSGSLEPAGRTPPAEASSKATPTGRPQAAPAPGEKSQLLLSNLSTNPLNPGKKTSRCVRHNAQDRAVARAARDHLPSVRKSQAGPLVARTQARTCCLASQPLPPSFSPGLGHVFFASCSVRAEACSSLQGDGTGSPLFGFSPVMTSGRHGVLPDRSAPAGVTSKPQRGRPACLDINLRRQRDKRGIPGDKPTPTDSRGQTPRPVQDQMLFSAGAPPIQRSGTC
jgi:hypothetical protein